MELKIKDSTAIELMGVCRDAVARSEDFTLPVMVEDEEGRVEHIAGAWYDETRGMLRLTLRGVRFEDHND